MESWFANNAQHWSMQYQDCFRDDYGNVIFSYRNSELVKVSIAAIVVDPCDVHHFSRSGSCYLQVSRAGDITLNTRGQGGREFRGVSIGIGCRAVSASIHDLQGAQLPADFYFEVIE